MKIVLRIFKWLGISIVSLIALLVILLALDRDYGERALTEAEKAAIRATPEFSQVEEAMRYEELLREYGKNKVLAPGFELACLVALSHYPELKEVPIEFRVQPAFIPLSSRPDPITIVFPWIRRNYLVVISDASEDFFEPILMKRLPFNEQVGVVGHELAHTVYYLDKSAMYLAQLAYKYQDNNFLVPFERDTDKRAIAHGLGYQLYDYAFFVRKAFGDSQEEIAKEEGGAYLSPKELAAEMIKYDFYKDTLPSPDSYFME